MTIYTDAATISTTTAPISTAEVDAFVEAATISSVTTPSANERGPFNDSSTIGSVTALSANERGPFNDSTTIPTVSTPAVLVELQTTVQIDISGSYKVGYPIVATIHVGVPTGSVSGGTTGTFTGSGTSVGGETVTSYVTPQGYWGSADNDSGIIP